MSPNFDSLAKLRVTVPLFLWKGGLGFRLGWQPWCSAQSRCEVPALFPPDFSKGEERSLLLGCSPSLLSWWERGGGIAQNWHGMPEHLMCCTKSRNSSVSTRSLEKWVGLFAIHHCESSTAPQLIARPKWDSLSSYWPEQRKSVMVMGGDLELLMFVERSRIICLSEHCKWMLLIFMSNSNAKIITVKRRQRVL